MSSTVSETPTFVVTAKAAQMVKTIMKNEGKENAGLRVTVMPGGCAGYTYGLDFADANEPEDIVLEMEGLKIFINEDIEPLIQGAKLDFVESLQGAGFVLDNLSPYRVGTHQHTPEIVQALGFPVCFVPHLLPVKRGLLATLLPFVYDPEAGDHGALLGHVARNNDQWRKPAQGESLAIVRGPDAYVSPSWYPDKLEQARVPTWNSIWLSG